MSKYIIEIPDGVPFVLLRREAHGKFITKVVPVAELEILNSDYINEHYGSLQDEAYQKGINDGSLDVKLRVEGAYQRGLEDGKNSTEKGCEGCRYVLKFANYDPCKNCSNCYTSKYEPMPKEDDRIEVGDEVIWSDGSTIIVTMVYVDGGSEWCDGVNQNGRAYHVLLENVRKTDKHYDIQSILEAMKK